MPALDAVDYRKILRRYIMHVGEQEGVTFLEYIDSLSGLTDDEFKALMAVVDELDGSDQGEA